MKKEENLKRVCRKKKSADSFIFPKIEVPIEASIEASKILWNFYHWKIFKRRDNDLNYWHIHFS